MHQNFKAKKSLERALTLLNEEFKLKTEEELKLMASEHHVSHYILPKAD
jgi:hypothetical protein